jgi:perosamine synthetase
MKAKGCIQLASPFLGEEELKAAADVLASGRLVCGPKVKEFETAVSRKVGMRHALAVNSGTMAIYALLHSLRMEFSDEVIIPALTFPSAAECVMIVGAKPVFVDVSRDTFNLNPQLLDEVLTPRTRAVISIDQFGVPADYAAIREKLKGRNVFILEDAACALGASFGGRPCGSLGDASIFSFHPRKVITTGEGGMALTNDHDMSVRLDMFRNHGIDETGNFMSTGLNLRMGEVEAALGLCQFRKLDAIVEKRTLLAAEYQSRLTDHVLFQRCPEGAACNWQTMAVVLPPRFGEEGRNGVIAGMLKRGIELRVASFCVPELVPYRALSAGRSFPEASEIHRCGVALPLHPAMTLEEAAVVAEALKEVMAEVGAER